MKKKLLLYIFAISLLGACNPIIENDIDDDSDVEVGELVVPTESNSAPSVKEQPSENIIKKPVETTDPEEIETENEYLLNKDDLSEITYLNTFLPKGHRVLDFKYGDLNKDAKKKDVILIAQNLAAEQSAEGDEVKRPLFILTRTADGKLKQEGRNDHVTLCSDCGGAMGDPYQSIAIKNGYFSIEHYGGSSIRWTEIITFRYNANKKNWYLHKKGGESFHASDADKVTESNVATTKDFGEVKFADYK